MIKRLVSCLLALLLIFAVSGCTDIGGNSQPSDSQGVSVTDAHGNTVRVKKGARVVSCYASFADCWILSGGELVGVTEDAVEEGRIEISKEVQILGTVKSIDIEKLVSAQPDYVLLSADLSAHLQLKDTLDALRINYGYFRVDTFEDYANLMRQFCSVNEREDLYEENVETVRRNIAEIISKLPDESNVDFLLVRAFSSGMKAKTEDNLAGQILAQMGLKNIASENPSLLEELSLEKILEEDPQYIFVSTMGNEAGAIAYLENNVKNNPAWQGLSAVKNENYVLLPKELFHYKPNNRWDESYEYLAKIIYPEIFG